ncbi:uncharacterized protein LTR77_007601 [Saxophila tyrrhenica]|uniref:Right handed beta helix domain-containing protein n=1 Tax=Saxophila tyrrhenica TaxID=1690608 RepID=A0AAV9P5W6_9PEZI|nr:hypothetical protein LTR77_007601 [Saxophila tyrrhenica]
MEQLWLTLMLALSVILGLSSGDSNADRHRTIHVKAGQKIQKAIDTASAGSEIVVHAGTYREQLLIKKDGISLSGKEGAVLAPPDSFVRNVCSGVAGPGTQAGICVAGSGIKMDPFVTEHRKVVFVQRAVEGVSVSGFQVEGFSGANILVLGADHTRIAGNTLIDGPIYGLLSSGSRFTTMGENTISSSDPAAPGIIASCMDNFEGAYGAGNDIRFYVIGLCIQTNGAVLRDNDVSYTCRAAYADPYVEGIRLTSNHFGPSYDACKAFASYGVTLAGTINALVEGNTIEQTRNNGPAAGVWVTDDPCTEPSLACLANPGATAVSKGNKVVGNKLFDNDLDLWNNSTGSGNVFKKNKCSTSIPKGLCRR